MIGAASATKALWYVSRGSGVVSLLLLTFAVLLGGATSFRLASRRWPRFLVEGLHKNLSLLSVVFLGIHIVTVVVDGYVPIRWLDVVLPFGSAYQPLWLGLGAVALDLFIAVMVTSLLRVRLGRRVWRAVHWSAYACWPIALVHGVGLGSDRTQTWMLGIDLAAVLSVLGLALWRLATVSDENPDIRPALVQARVAVPTASPRRNP